MNQLPSLRRVILTAINIELPKYRTTIEHFHPLEHDFVPGPVPGVCGRCGWISADAPRLSCGHTPREHSELLIPLLEGLRDVLEGLPDDVSSVVLQEHMGVILTMILGPRILEITGQVMMDALQQRHLAQTLWEGPTGNPYLN